MIRSLPHHRCENVRTDGTNEGVRFTFVEHLNSLERSQCRTALSVTNLVIQSEKLKSKHEKVEYGVTTV